MSAPAKNCPICKNALSHMVFQHIHLDVCPGECGVWFDKDELAETRTSDSLANIDRAFPGTYRPYNTQQAIDDVPGRACPIDASLLERFEWNTGSGLVFDRCHICHGTWLDAGELEGFTGFVDRFEKNPPELTPEIKAKLDKINLEWEQKYDAMEEAAIDSTLAHSWIFKTVFGGSKKGLYFLDDIMRLIIR